MTGTRRTIVLTGIAGLVVGGVAGGLIGWASTGDTTTATTNTAQSAPAQSHGHKQQGKAAAGKRHRAGTIGTITAVDGTSWTVAARDGKSVTVQIGTDTEFGTAKQPEQRSDFVVGDRVVVLGKDKAGTVDATRIAKRATKPGSSTAPSSSVPGATTQPS